MGASIIPCRPVKDKWGYPRKNEGYFQIKPGQSRGMTLTIFYSFPEFPKLMKSTEEKHGN